MHAQDYDLSVFIKENHPLQEYRKDLGFGISVDLEVPFLCCNSL